MADLIAAYRADLRRLEADRISFTAFLRVSARVYAALEATGPLAHDGEVWHAEDGTIRRYPLLAPRRADEVPQPREAA
jgi:hypothetical protein